MAETHTTAQDPDAAPMHLDVRERFTALQVTICAAAGAVAIIAGIVLGLVVANN
jgi:hypothetical protein